MLKIYFKKNPDIIDLEITSFIQIQQYKDIVGNK